MSSEWLCTKLSLLGTFDRGKSKHRPRDAAHLYNGPYPFIQTGDITASGGKITTYRQTYSEAGLAQSKLWPKNTLAITIAANIAETALLSFPACFPDSVVGFTAHPEKADVRFIEYLFRAMRENVKRRAYGSVQENINLMVLRDLEFPVPSLEAQKKIADFLSLLDDRISLLLETNKTLEAIAQAIFKSWFVDFDPVRAKQEGREPEGMDADTAALFPDSFEESELGLIPKGWKAKPLNKILTAKNERVGESDVAEYSSTNCGLQLRSEIFKKQLSVSRSKNKLVHKGDLVFGLSRQILNFGLMRDSVGCVSPAYKVFTVDQEAIAPDLLERLMRFHTGYFFNAISASSREGQSISSDGIGLLKILQPTKDVQHSFYAFTESIHNRIEVLLDYTVTLTQLRDTLLPRLISGQLRLPEAEKLVNEVTP